MQLEELLGEYWGILVAIGNTFRVTRHNMLAGFRKHNAVR